MLDIFDYIEPCDDNLKTYSHVIHSMLLKICSEFETYLKLVAKLHYPDISSIPKPTIQDYRLMENGQLGFQERSIGLYFWRPTVKYIEPFENWTTNSPPIKWYNDYHKVKHDREVNFHLANFENLIMAFSGLFQTALQTNIIPTGKWIIREDGNTEAIFPEYQMSFLDRKK